ncbi:polysaccharide pyruvyl transferase family protein [Caballeronia sp. GAFFF1]|uniref:polysaccharide pyruvyl transferase family protein n=1 Tax=Caballeronia sp. GAFFF1 TaxID=2921779 RepID=UPI00202828E4|nr:polysaccharide pyruvyl transferase family protein [Caballeronia sp. GAFFF1]
MINATVVIFGAFDRHNFGDMLFAHIEQRLLAERLPDAKPVFAGLAARDLRRYGGHAVAALGTLAGRLGDKPVTFVHAGGELLTCDAWEAAVMLNEPEDAQTVIARYGARAEERSAYARALLNSDALAPYVVGRETWPQASSVRFNAVGGVSLDTREAALRNEVLTKLRCADDLSVRDAHTQAMLRAAGIEARLVPDPVTMIAELFDSRIASRARHGPAADVRRACPRGHLAVQFSADFGDDATLDRLARELDALAASTGHGIALFRAGAAPWHDDIDAYERLAARMHHRAFVFRSLDIWDICALIATSAGYAGSSLHGRIVAMAYGLPRISMLHPDEAARTGKQAAYAQTWDDKNAPGAVSIDELEAAMRHAMSADREALRQRGLELARSYRASATQRD